MTSNDNKFINFETDTYFDWTNEIKMLFQNVSTT